MKHLIIGGHDGTSYAMCGAEGTGPDFEDRQPEDGDCPGCLEVWREVDPGKPPFQLFCEDLVRRWPTADIGGDRRDSGVMTAGIELDGQTWYAGTDGNVWRVGWGYLMYGEGADLDAAMKAWAEKDPSPAVMAITRAGLGR